MALQSPGHGPGRQVLDGLRGDRGEGLYVRVHRWLHDLSDEMRECIFCDAVDGHGNGVGSGCEGERALRGVVQGKADLSPAQVARDEPGLGLRARAVKEGNFGHASVSLGV